MNGLSKPCWICGAAATTGEHQHKKSDVKQMFGRGHFNGVVKHDYESGDKIRVQGPNSKAIKYINNLCACCNNNLTQTYDLAYEKFSKHIKNNFVGLGKTLCINTNAVFGKCDAREHRRNLYLYFVKAFGCQLNDKGLKVPHSLRDALLGKNYNNSFRISICLNHTRQKFLQTFPLEGDQDKHSQPINYYWAQDNGWFTVVCAFNRPINAEFGEE